MRWLMFALIGTLVLAPSLVEAASAVDPNAVQENVRFRRRVDPRTRFRRNSRGIERQRLGATGTGSSFDQRADELRKAQLKRTQEELESRKFNQMSRGIRRSRLYQERLRKTQSQRILDAVRQRSRPNTVAPRRGYYRRAEDVLEQQDRAEQQEKTDLYDRIYQLRFQRSRFVNCDGVSRRRRQACEAELLND